jgi:uncharacterized protein YyaL (SSP411 family)
VELLVGGAYASSLDADSDGAEGRFYLWTKAEILALAGPSLGERLCQHLGVTTEGNFEEEPGKNVLTRQGEDDDELRQGKRLLLAARAKRPRPFRDDKILLGWNALAVSGLAKGGAILGDEVLLRRARRVIDTLATNLRDGSGRLLRSFLNGPSDIPAFSEDYAALALAYLDLFDATWHPDDLHWAKELATGLIDRFYLPELGAMALASSDSVPLVHRPLSLYDNAVPGATGLALSLFLRLQALTGEARFGETAQAIVERQASAVAENPFGFGQLLCGLYDDSHPAIELIIVGDPADPRTRALVQPARSLYAPNRLTVVFAPGRPPPDLARSLSEGREGVSEPTAFVCRGQSCLLPTTDPQALRACLDDKSIAKLESSR